MTDQLTTEEPDAREYPKVLYHATEAPRTVHNQTEHEELGDGWEETPAAFEKPKRRKKEEPAE